MLLIRFTFLVLAVVMAVVVAALTDSVAFGALALIVLVALTLLVVALTGRRLSSTD